MSVPVSVHNSLLSLQANVNTRDDNGATALFYAAANGRHQNVRLLLNAGADANVTDSRGLTPLCVATRLVTGNLETISLLLDYEMETSGAATAALFCLDESLNRVAKLRFLISKGGDPNAFDLNGKPLLVHYAENPNDFYDVVRSLHETSNVDLNLRSKAGHTALMAAAVNGNERTVKALIQMGADCRVEADDGRTSLNMANDAALAVQIHKYEYERIIGLLTRCEEQQIRR